MSDGLKMWERGRAIEGAVAFRREEEMWSGPEAVLDGRLDIREMINYSVHKELGHVGGRKMGGVGLKGGAELLKQEEKNELRQSALSESDEWVLFW